MAIDMMHETDIITDVSKTEIYGDTIRRNNTKS